MSILIKGMEMPTRCYTCPCADLEYYDCNLMPGTRIEQHKRLDGCPLVEIPPHGRLIEDVAVREQIDEWLDSVGDVVVGHGLSYYGELLGCIEDAPTIIEAEEGK